MKHTDLTYYHRLAIRYFNGELDYTDEKKLFCFIKDSLKNEKLFRQWEKEWLSSPKVLPKVDEEWECLKRRILLRPSIEECRNRSLLWKKVAAAIVGGLIFLTTCFMGIYYYKAPQQKNDLFTLKTERAEKTRLLLPDGTIVYLNASSSLSYTSNFNSNHREVHLSGEAYFEVSKQQDDIPFVVKTDFYDVIVKGTQFNISVYPEDTKVSTALLNGLVDIVYKGKHIPVSPGELVYLDKKEQKLSREKVQAEQYRSWTEGRFEYDRISLQELINRLSRRYDVTIRLDEKIQKDIIFRISLRNEETIDDILKALSQIVPISYEKQGRSVYIKIKTK